LPIYEHIIDTWPIQLKNSTDLATGINVQRRPPIPSGKDRRATLSSGSRGRSKRNRRRAKPKGEFFGNTFWIGQDQLQGSESIVSQYRRFQICFHARPYNDSICIGNPTDSRVKRRCFSDLLRGPRIWNRIRLSWKDCNVRTYRNRPGFRETKYIGTWEQIEKAEFSF